MHPAIFAAFDQICREQQAGGRVLEIGAVPHPSTLLALPSLAGASEKLGINIAGASRGADFRILAGDANAMSDFADASFDVILCNSMLEHDRRFWLTLREVRRVARPGALVAIGVPGYAELRMPLRRLGRWLARLPVLGAAARRQLDALKTGTPTLAPHNMPGDYYRFSEQAVREVFLEGLDAPQVRRLLAPPRILGWGRVPGTAPARP
jgi:SAM-dependent methyltransferase